MTIKKVNSAKIISTFCRKVRSKVFYNIAVLIFKIKWHRVLLLNMNQSTTYFSQDGQDHFLSSLLFNAIEQNQTSWVVDVGCNHPIYYSNSYFFEKYLGCKVLAIDAQSSFQDDWSTLRPNSIFVSAAVGQINGSIDLYVNGSDVLDNMFSFVQGGTPKSMESNNIVKTRVPLFRLSTILDQNKISEILLLSIDIEGFEYDALMGIDFAKVFIACICVENNSIFMGESKIREFLIAHGYTFYARIGNLDDIFVHKSVINGDR